MSLRFNSRCQTLASVSFAALLVLSAGDALARQGAPLPGNAEAKPGTTERVALLVSTTARHVDLSELPHEQSQRRREVVERLRRGALAIPPELLDWMRSRGGTPKVLWICQCVAVTLPASSVPELKQRPDVVGVRYDTRFSALSMPGTAGSAASGLMQAPDDWHLVAAGVPLLWNAAVTGDGVVVGILDSGADVDAAGLSGNWRGGPNSWFDTFGEHAEPYDATGHGTQTLALAVGGSVDGVPVGVAPGAKWIAARIFDDSGNTDLSHLHLGFQWMLDPDNEPSTDDLPDIVVSSWGFVDNVNECILEFSPDIDALRAAGVSTVFAAGNSGPGNGSTVSPGNNPGSLSVGAIDSEFQVAFDSSRGPSACGDGWVPALLAPGVGVRTADLTYGVFPNASIWVEGTSFAAPQVAGYLALLRSAFPDASPLELEQALEATALDVGPGGPDYESGYGMAQPAAAYDAMQAPGKCALVGSEGAMCDDGDACTGGDSCKSGVCAGGEVLCEPCGSDCDDVVSSDEGGDGGEGGDERGDGGESYEEEDSDDGDLGEASDAAGSDQLGQGETVGRDWAGTGDLRADSPGTGDSATGDLAAAQPVIDDATAAKGPDSRPGCSSSGQEQPSAVWGPGLLVLVGLGLMRVPGRRRRLEPGPGSH